MAVDLSTAILQLSENGDLQRIHDKWLSSDACSSQTNPVDENRLSLDSFWGLFLVCGIACSIGLLLFFWRIWQQYRLVNKDDEEEAARERELPPDDGSRRSTQRATSFKSILDIKEKE